MGRVIRGLEIDVRNFEEEDFEKGSYTFPPLLLLLITRFVPKNFLLFLWVLICIYRCISMDGYIYISMIMLAHAWYLLNVKIIYMDIKFKEKTRLLIGRNVEIPN